MLRELCKGKRKIKSVNEVSVLRRHGQGQPSQGEDNLKLLLSQPENTFSSWKRKACS